MDKRGTKMMYMVGRGLRWLLRICGTLVLALVLCFTVVLVVGGLPGILRTGPLQFFGGAVWSPESGQYGIGILFVTTLYSSGAAVLLALGPAILVALFMARQAPPAVHRLMRLLGEVLNSLPTVVYGLLGVVVLLPWIHKTFPSATQGEGLLAVILLLAMIVLPRLVSMIEACLYTVPREVELAAFGLGATKAETWFMVTLRHARPDILIAFVMQYGVMTGEALAVMMVAGNIAAAPRLFGSVSTLATAVAGSAFDANAEHTAALMSLCLALFLFSLVRFALVRLLRRCKRGGGFF